MKVSKLFHQFTHNGRAVLGMKANALKHIAQEGFSIGFGITPSLKEIIIKDVSSESSESCGIAFEIGNNLYFLRKEFNFIYLRVQFGDTHSTVRVFIHRINAMEVEE